MALPNKNPPRIPEFYTLTKMHKPTPVGRPIISGCDGPTEKLSSFVDYCNRLHLFHSLKTRKSLPTLFLFNGCNEPVYEHTTRGGNLNSMQGMRNILLKQTSYPNSTTGTSATANSPRKLIPV